MQAQGCFKRPTDFAISGFTQNSLWILHNSQFGAAATCASRRLFGSLVLGN